MLNSLFPCQVLCWTTQRQWAAPGVGAGGFRNKTTSGGKWPVVFLVCFLWLKERAQQRTVQSFPEHTKLALLTFVAVVLFVCCLQSWSCRTADFIYSAEAPARVTFWPWNIQKATVIKILKINVHQFPIVTNSAWVLFVCLFVLLTVVMILWFASVKHIMVSLEHDCSSIYIYGSKPDVEGNFRMLVKNNGKEASGLMWTLSPSPLRCHLVPLRLAI